MSTYEQCSCSTVFDVAVALVCARLVDNEDAARAIEPIGAIDPLQTALGAIDPPKAGSTHQS